LNPEEQQHDFLSGVIRLISGHPNSAVMVIVHSPDGLKIVSNGPDFVYQMGILQACLQIVQSRFAMLTIAEMKSGKISEMETSIEETMDNKPKGGVN